MGRRVDVTEIRFYHLQRRPLEWALPLLLEKTLERGWRAVVMARSKERVEALNGLLWTYSKDGFLPHGSSGDPYPGQHPVWLTETDENPNGATVLFLTGGAESAKVDQYDLCCELFDGNADDAVTAARVRWKRYLESAHALTYWRQSDNGGWKKKAETSG